MTGDGSRCQRCCVARVLLDAGSFFTCVVGVQIDSPETSMSRVYAVQPSSADFLADEGLCLALAIRAAIVAVLRSGSSVAPSSRRSECGLRPPEANACSRYVDTVVT